MIQHFADILLVVGVVLLALALGSRLMAALRVVGDVALEQMVMATGLGLGVIAYTMLALGLLGWLKLSVVAVVLLLLFLSQLREIGDWLRIGWRWLKQQQKVPRPFSERALTVYLIVVSLVLLLATLCPPGPNDWDGLSYHLAAPKNFIRHQRIFYISFDHHSNFPFTVEMLYTLGLLLRGWTMEATGGAVAAKLFHYVFALLCALTIYAFCGRYLSRTAGLVGAAIFLSMPIVAGEAISAYADLGLAAYTLLAFYAFWNWKAEERVGEERMGEEATSPTRPHAHTPIRPHAHTLLAGIFAGLAMGTKYSGLFIFGWLGLLMLAQVVRARQGHRAPVSQTQGAPEPVRDVERRIPRRIEASVRRDLLRFAVVAILIASPWYVKNVIYTRNPFYPFLYSVFGGYNWSAEHETAYRGHQREFGMGRSLVDLVLLPWRVTMWPWNYDPEWDRRPAPQRQKGFEVKPFPTSALGPALLIFVVPLLFLRGHPKVIVYLLVTALVFLLGWFFVLAQYNRYLFPLLPLLSVCAGYAVVTFARRSQPLRFVSVAALILSCVFTFLLIVSVQPNELKVALGQMSEVDYLRRFNVYTVSEFINANLPPSAKIVTYGETRWFYLDRDYLWGEDRHHTLIHYEPRILPHLLKEYRRLGITHVLFSTATMQGTPEQRLLMEGTARDAFTPLWNERGFVLLEINDA